jgi:hypothetical protein
MLATLLSVSREFPTLPPQTAGASNPTYTILALSLRGAEHLVGNWNAVAG